jgi:hypothetical protein
MRELEHDGYVRGYVALIDVLLNWALERMPMGARQHIGCRVRVCLSGDTVCAAHFGYHDLY